jgi:hypothetical protein
VGKEARTGGLAGKRPEMARKAIFSEGRGLRVRVVRPHECRGIPFSPNNEARGPWPTGHMPRSSPCAHRGRAEPAPPRGGPSRARWPCGENPGITQRSVFSEGRGLRVRVARPGSCGGKIFPGHAEPPLGSDERLRLTLGRYKVIEAQPSLFPTFGIFLAILTQWSQLGTDPRGLRKGPSFPRWLRRQEGGGFCLSGREEIATEETDRPRHTMDTQ